MVARASRLRYFVTRPARRGGQSKWASQSELDEFPAQLAVFGGTRGATEMTAEFGVTNAGYHPFRVVCFPATDPACLKVFARPGPYSFSGRSGSFNHHPQNAVSEAAYGGRCSAVIQTGSPPGKTAGAGQPLVSGRSALL